MFSRVLARIGFRGVILAAAALGLAAVAGCSSSSSAPAQAATTVKGACTTTISNQTVGNVLVPAGATCTLNNVTVHGNITVYGTLQLTTSKTIGGNVVGEPGSTLNESGPTTVTIDGNETVNAPSEFNLSSDYVLGNLTYEHAFNPYATDMHIGGSIYWLDNGGESLINGDTVAGNIICSGNASAPTNNGTPNTVHGHETGQCAGLH